MSDEEAEPESTRKKSVKSYASRVFKESSVKAISSIASTGSVRRRVFRATIFLLFTVGFLYQCIKFLAHVFTYPTVVSIEIIKPDSYILPAYTFCNYNKVKRSKFCEKYPDRCVVPDETFCEKYPNYCADNFTKVPKEEFFGFPWDPISPEEVIELSPDLKDLLKNYDKRQFNDVLDGPFLRQGYSSTLGSCFSYRSRVNSSLDPAFATREYLRLPFLKEPELVFDAEETEKFTPYSEVGVILSIHSQFDAVNPFENGIFLKPNYSYYITISMHQEKLLKHPYKTDCHNYTENWLENGKTGPRSQEMCRRVCLHKFFDKCFGCTLFDFNYPSHHNYCRTDDELKNRETEECYLNPVKVTEDITLCFKNCKDECWQMKYEYRIEEKKVEKMFRNKTAVAEDFEKLIQVYIDFDDAEIYSFEYKAQYQEVETFSYIGGFIGIWLGVSLVELADFFESAFRITRYFFRKGSNRCLKKSTSA